MVASISLQWGFNIHHGRMPVDTRQAELAQVARGATIARDDFTWAAIEKTAGTYDFSDFDALHDSLRKLNVTPYFILDYGNPAVNCAFRGSHAVPHSQRCNDAFCKFAVASMARYATKQADGEQPIIWELWNGAAPPCMLCYAMVRYAVLCYALLCSAMLCFAMLVPEPNTQNFWGGAALHGNATEYAALASALHAARSAAGLLGSTVLAGPAIAGFGQHGTGPQANTSWEYLETLSAAGTLRTFDAISVHAYRVGPPESVLPDYARLLTLAPAGTPLISGEWGWSTCTPGKGAKNCPAAALADEAHQARWLARQWLLNGMSNINISIFYDYVEDCDDAGDRECRFGATRAPFLNASVPHEPKPAFTAATVLQRHLGGRAFLRRVDAGAAAVFALGFTGGALAAWNAEGAPTASCAVAPPMKGDCGFWGISKAQCLGPPREPNLSSSPLLPGHRNRSRRPQLLLRARKCQRAAVLLHTAQLHRHRQVTCRTARAWDLSLSPGRSPPCASFYTGPGCFRVFDLHGDELAQACPEDTGVLNLEVDDAPRVLVPM